MDDIRLGSAFRIVRIRKHLRQEDVARRARVRRETVSRMERGLAGRERLDTLRAVAGALGLRMDVRARLQGGDIDRILNEGHARLHEGVVDYLTTLPGWVWRPEVSFSIYGERGVIDILAWHAESRSLLIIELKTELVDPQELAGTMDRRVRLGPAIARQRGWLPLTVSAWVIVADSSTNHRRLDRHSGLLRTAFPASGHAARSWMRRPAGTLFGLSFWSDVRSGSVTRKTAASRRVRHAKREPIHARLERVQSGRASSAPPSVSGELRNGPHADI